MSKDDDLLDDVVARLWRARERLGPDVYCAAGPPCTLLRPQSSMRRRGVQLWIGFPA